jgi:hypothetical protein
MNGATNMQRRHGLQTGGATSSGRQGTAHRPVYRGTTLPFGIKRRHRYSMRRCWWFESSVTRNCVAGWNTGLWRYQAHFLEITLYCAARGNDYKLRVFYRNRKIIWGLGIPIYYSTCGPRTGQQLRLWPFAITRVEHPRLSLFASSTQKLGQLSSLFCVIQKLTDAVIALVVPTRLQYRETAETHYPTSTMALGTNVCQLLPSINHPQLSPRDPRQKNPVSDQKSAGI